MGLQHDEVTDACLIEPPGVVDHQHVSGCCRFECLQKHIDAASVPGGADASGEATSRHDASQERGCAAHRHLGPDTRVGKVGSGEGREPIEKFVVIHGESLCHSVAPCKFAALNGARCAPSNATIRSGRLTQAGGVSQSTPTGNRYRSAAAFSTRRAWWKCSALSRSAVAETEVMVVTTGAVPTAGAAG